jgi:hypothetical protein
MGKNIVLFVLLLVILAGAIWQSVYVGQATSELTHSLEQIRMALKEGDTALAIQKTNDFDAYWQKEKSTYEALFEHKEVDTISASAKKLISLCTSAYIPEALATIDEISFYIEHIKSIDSLGWENIF